MDKESRNKKVILYGVFFFYILLLLKILLLSRISHLEHRSINLIPFKSIMEYISGSTANLRTFAFSNVVGNILIFIPLGAYITLFKKDKRILNNLSIIYIVSLLVEITQGILGIGAADIDDIILNCFGGLIGILGYKYLLLLLGDRKRVDTAITILSVVGLPGILYYLFVIRLRL